MGQIHYTTEIEQALATALLKTTLPYKKWPVLGHHGWDHEAWLNEGEWIDAIHYQMLCSIRPKGEYHAETLLRETLVLPVLFWLEQEGEDIIVMWHVEPNEWYPERRSGDWRTNKPIEVLR